MKKIDERELKKIQIDILDNINKFCIDNNIKYWIDYGTLLGAVRHKGYIPWDDDIDIGMLREDYDKLIKLFNKSNNRYVLKDYILDKNWHYSYGKILDTDTIMYEPDEKNGIKSSVFIDIFIYDDLSNDDRVVKNAFKKRKLYGRLHVLQTYKVSYYENKRKFNFIRLPLHLILKLFPKNYFVKKIVQIEMKYASNDAKMVGLLCEKLDVAFDKEDFADVTKIEFEGKKYFAPKDYDKHLKLAYGNYMELPPKEKRISNHKFVAYYKD